VSSRGGGGKGAMLLPYTVYVKDIGLANSFVECVSRSIIEHPLPPSGRKAHHLDARTFARDNLVGSTESDQRRVDPRIVQRGAEPRRRRCDSPVFRIQVRLHVYSPDYIICGV
jgi:hypothetical protein